ncbi:MAG: C39 family peptidase [Patescibacteria group bacterium]|jgi:peptidoglycan hydrolase CwlO-like protein
MVKKILVFIVIFFLIIVSVRAQDTTDLQKKISEYQEKLQQLKQQKNTLSSQIQYMDTQIDLTSLQINQTEQKIISTGKEIDLLGSRIEGLDQSLDYLSKQLIQRIVIGYKKKPLSIFSLLFDNKNAYDFLNQVKYLKTAQDNTQKLLYTVQETKTNAEEQKKLREEKKIELDKLTETLNYQKQSLDNQRDQKQRLLNATQSDETTYQRLLSQAQEQLASFGRFVQGQGGSSLLSNQTSCDDWGCYYSQRDSQWGSNSLNGTGYTLASDGCLVTSMAMVYTHLGRRNVNPQTINSNSSNFASYYPAYLEYTISADGLTTSRISASIDSTLSSGDPVVVGVRAYGGTHFVVLTSGSNGDYTMNDPFIENGHKISFNSHYSVGSIFEIRKVVPQ